MRKNWRGIILYGGYLLFVTLLLLEIGVRLWGYSERYIYDPIYRTFEPREDIPYIHKSNLKHARGRGLTLINTDSLGLRSPISGTVHAPKSPHEYRIAIAGDSYTFGEGVPNTQDTFPQVLEDRLNQQQNSLTVKVFNFGVAAYSVKQMVATLEHRMMEIQPDVVVMAIIPPDFNLERTPVVDKVGYLVDQKFSSLPFYATITHVLREVRLMYVLRGIVLNWFAPPQYLDPNLARGTIPPSYRYIQQFKETADRFGLPYVIVLIPRMQENAWGPLPLRLKQDGIRYLDLSNLSREFTRDQYMASPFDVHASAAVHHRIGESLAEYVQHLPDFVH